jgi:hypothetical protein
MNRTRRDDRRALSQQGERAQPGAISQTQMQGLPEPMQRYLRYAQVSGKASISTVRLTQHGAMRTQPGKPWQPFDAHQYVTTNPAAFLWHARMRLFPRVWISATDRFSQGHGGMRIQLLSIIPMGHAQGPEMDQSEMQRYLAEMIWFPTAWLTSAIEWQAIDAHAVQATLRASGTAASVTLHVNEHGQVTRVTADRYKEEHRHYLLAPWSAQCDEYQEVEGIRIPTSIAITWHLPSGDFPWFRCKITQIEYHQSGKVRSLSP